MGRVLARRFAGTLVTLVVISLVTFVALMSTPGDTASALVGESASAAQLQTVRAELGLDQPLLVRYGAFLANLTLRGDLGRSLISNRPVAELVLERLPYTLVLAFAAISLAALIGALLGGAAAIRSGSVWDTLLMSGAALGLALPTFWSALLLIMLFALRLHWLPVVGAESWQHLVLPTVTLALPTAAAVARLMRSSLLDVLGADYVRTAHAKGLVPRQVLHRHVVRNSLIPVVTVLGLHLGHLIGGAFVVETIFGWPGLGRMIVQSIFDRDYPVVMGATLVIAAMYICINLLVDLAHGWLDPQIGHAAV
jgi:ABC-type dipeptide/oligopeptide/nickel transport system permease component